MSALKEDLPHLLRRSARESAALFAADLSLGPPLLQIMRSRATGSVTR
jgi:hypothetical protein